MPLLAPALLLLLAQTPTVEVVQVRAVGGVARSGRIPIPNDKVIALLSQHGYAAIDRLETLPLTKQDGSKAEWKELKANADGWYEDEALGGGYALADVKASVAGTYILNASGHTAAYVDGQIRFGDPYQYGYVHQPVKLKAGVNKILFPCGRGRLKMKFYASEAPTFLVRDDATLPDLIATDQESAPASMIVVNASNTERKVRTTATLGGRSQEAGEVLVPAMGFRKVPVLFPGSGELAAGEHEATVSLSSGSEQYGEQKVGVRVVNAGQVRKRTFVSRIDGSIQYYAVNPAQQPGPDNALVFSLHGASVEAIGQAQAYGPKDKVTLVAPTNRRPFGFDWEDVGRLDALEVMEHAMKTIPHDPSKVFLTGHSMGGHGTWHIGLTFPDKFGAIAPSAGWSSFFSYAGSPKLSTEGVEGIFARAMNPSDTLKLVRNSLSYPIYILHGDADDNVPVTEARLMKDALAFHPSLTLHEQKGAGHWWGNECVDWPPIFELFAKSPVPPPAQRRTFEFVTANPAISSRYAWATIEQQITPAEFSSIKVQPESEGLAMTTENVAALTIDAVALGAAASLKIDGAQVQSPSGTMTYRKTEAGWIVSAPIPTTEKIPARSGPFKMVFNNNFLFVYGTKGSAAERNWSRNKAVADAEAFAYRGNGSVDVVADTDYDAEKFAGRNVLVYGNADTNGAWRTLLGDSPVYAKSGEVFIRGHNTKGDGLIAMVVRPHPQHQNALVAAIAPTGPKAFALADRLPIFTSGVAYPDWCVIGPEATAKGLDGVLGAGFFDSQWRYDEKNSAWRAE